MHAADGDAFAPTPTGVVIAAPGRSPKAVKGPPFRPRFLKRANGPASGLSLRLSPFRTLVAEPAYLALLTCLPNCAQLRPKKFLNLDLSLGCIV